MAIQSPSPQTNTLKNIYFFRHYSFLLPEAKYKEKHREDSKIQLEKKMLQTLPIALAQVKACNNSENLLN